MSSEISKPSHLHFHLEEYLQLQNRKKIYHKSDANPDNAIQILRKWVRSQYIGMSY